MSSDIKPDGQSRRSFLVKLGLGVTALAGVSSGLVGLSKKETAAKDQDFPEVGSIFHPAQDPRTDPRRV
ncbi:MAG: twin-arginine translocation signal domain-containing protein [Chloroflexi bacterium]|nr:twin-arginine translocation signal domain-containing protein [Chloroflexota bacterium]PKB57129.1 MAG: hypothetical protein BZY73_04875 [SAR202 cluster bacterium Casp-Chloro-G3]